MPSFEPDWDSGFTLATSSSREDNLDDKPQPEIRLKQPPLGTEDRGLL